MAHMPDWMRRHAPPPGEPDATPATISGTIVAADILDASAQGIAAGQFNEVFRAMRAGVTYANVHTDGFAAGEIRGLIDGWKDHQHPILQTADAALAAEVIAGLP